jgi:methionyl-tRNA formyltransferase
MPHFSIIFAGSGEFGLPALRAVLEAGQKIVQVISQPDRPAGRGRQLTPTPIANFASTTNLPLLKTPDINVENLPLADLMIVIAFGQKIAPHIVNHPRLGSINLHASLLPKYRGAAPINWAIIQGEEVTGNSVIRLASRMDAGAILMQSRLEIGELATAGELHDRLSADGAHLIPRLIEALARGDAIEREQDESQATIAPKLSRQQSKLDFAGSAIELSRQIRGMYPWPGCRVRICDDSKRELDRVLLVRARALNAAGTEPGRIDARRHIACGAGALEIIELQPEGKRPMPLSAYRNGHAWEPGLNVESAV